MRKIISTMLVLVMVLSVFTSFSAGAAHWAQEAIDFVTENGYWIAPGEIEPDRPATRAETASLFARILISKIPENNGAYADVADDNIYGGDITAMSLMGLMVGYEDEFRPNDLVTREELACILDRASKIVSDEFKDTTYNMEFYKDSEEVSDWALQSIMNASQYVLMKGKGHKLFDPQGQTTLAEVATVVKSLADLSDMQKEASKSLYSVRDIVSSDNIERDFDVLQSAGIELSCGYGGWGMIARLPGGTTNIYVQRTHRDTQGLDAMAHPPVLLRVEDPEGNTICRVDMDYADGVMEKIITIPNAVEGIYRIRFTGGSLDDVVSIGLQQPISWGMLPMDIMRFTGTQSAYTDWYFYVPKKIKMCSFGIGGPNAVATIWSADGKTRVVSTEASTGLYYQKHASTSTLKPDTVYKFVLPEKFVGRFGFTGLSSLMCPTEEMARDLQGGYIYQTDKYGEFQFEGPLQAKARRRMVEIYEEMNGDFSIDIESLGVPEEAPTEGLDNPRAEAQMFAAYFGTLIGMPTTLERQVLDPSNPWFGCIATVEQQRGEEAWPDGDWQYRYYHNGGMRMMCQFIGALTTNAETNYWYGNSVLQKRVELGWLAWVVQMNVAGNYTYANVQAGSGCYTYFRQYENFQFGDQSCWSHGYYWSRNFLSPQTRAITDAGCLSMAEAAMYQRGQGVSNQMQMGVQGTLYTYMWSGDEFFHEWYARCILGMGYPSSRPNLGQMEQGYWREGASGDGGSYGRMNEGMWDDQVMYYLTLPEEQQRPEVVESIFATTERFLLFDSIWYTPPINGFTRINTNTWTAREGAGYGAGSAIPGNAYIQNIFPRAMANHDAQVAGVEDPDTFTDPNNLASAGTVASTILSDEWAYNHIKQYWPRYFKVFRDDRPNSYPARDSWSMYKALHETGKWFEYDEIPTMPYALEGNYNIHTTLAGAEGGALSAKHDGLYLINYYNHGNGDVIAGVSWIVPGPAQLWDEYFGTISAAMEPVNRKGLTGNTVRNADAQNYKKAFTEGEMVHTTIIGHDGAGQMLVEGKGEAVFNWIEEGKSWSVTHTDPFSMRNTTWKYFMHDEGWDFEAGFDAGVEATDDMWVQIPVVDVSYDVPEAKLTYDAEACTLTWSHEGHTVTLSWEKGTETKFEDKLGEESKWRFLKIKLTPEKPFAKFSITREMGDYKFVRGVRDGV